METTTNIEELIESALREDNAELLKPFLESKDRQDLVINYREPSMRKTLMVLAAEQGRLEIVRLLLKILDVYVPWRNDNTTPLMLAAKNDHLELVKLLLEKGANVNAIDSYKPLMGSSALHFACYSGHEEIAKVLYQNGATIFKERRNLIIANETLEKIFTADRRDIMHVILDNEKNRDRVYLEVLFTAIECNNVEFVELVLDRGWSIETVFDPLHFRTISDTFYPFYTDIHTPLSFAVSRSFPMVEMVNLLLDRGANVHWNENSPNFTALHYAAKWNESTNIMQLLLEYGADVNAKSCQGTPFHRAVRNNRERATKFLLSMGADVNIEEKGHSSHFLVCHRAAYPEKREEYLEVVKVVVCHIVKMQSKGLFVSESNLEAIRSDETLKAFQSSCKEEIEKMRGMKFADSFLTLFDVSKADDVLQLAAYAKNRELNDYLKSEKFREDFPIYSETIWDDVGKGVERNYLQARVCNFFMNLFTRKEDKLPKLPVLCASQIFSYLSDKDLINLRKAYY